jgi:glycosyltransferase involved in cell wall biosynthesis
MMSRSVPFRIGPAAGFARRDTQAGARLARRRIVLLQTQAEAAGAQEISRILARGLEARGHDVHSVFFFRRTGAFDDQPNTVFAARERPNGILPLVRMVIGLIRHLRAVRPDAVLCFQHYGVMIGTPLARLAGVRTVIANRTTARNMTPRAARWLEFVFGLTGLFSRNVVNCATIEQEYRGFPARYRARLARIDHGFEPKTTALGRDAARRSLGLPPDVILLGSVARLHPGKNLGAAIRLLPKRDWHLALVGQGPERQALTELAASLGVLDRVHFVGELPADRIGAFLRSLDVFVFPSLAETFGLAPVEAAQAGIPVVANDLPVLHETLSVSGNPCALFVDVDDTEAFAAAVDRVIDDPALRGVLCARGVELSATHSLDAMVQRYADLIESVLPRRHEVAR